MKTAVFNSDGQLLEIFDPRNLEEAKQEGIERKRQEATRCLLDTGLDTATQQNAALGIYDLARCEAIKNYIAACRNEYLRCKGLILASATNDEADAVQFVAPQVPEDL